MSYMLSSGYLILVTSQILEYEQRNYHRLKGKILVGFCNNGGIYGPTIKFIVNLDGWEYYLREDEVVVLDEYFKDPFSPTNEELDMFEMLHPDIPDMRMLYGS